MGFEKFLSNVKAEILNPLATVLVALAFFWFLYGLFEFVKNADNEEARAVGRQHMIWGIIGLFIMISVFGIINVICKTIGAGCTG